MLMYSLQVIGHITVVLFSFMFLYIMYRSISFCCARVSNIYIYGFFVSCHHIYIYIYIYAHISSLMCVLWSSLSFSCSSSTWCRYCYWIKPNSRSPNHDFYKEEEERGRCAWECLLFSKYKYPRKFFSTSEFQTCFYMKNSQQQLKKNLRSNRYSFKKCIGDRRKDTLTTWIDYSFADTGFLSLGKMLFT